MAKYKCKNCGNNTAFRFILQGEIVIDTKVKSQNKMDSLDASKTSIIEVICRSCGGKMSEGTVAPA